MGKYIRSGKVVILLAGRYAGKKAIVVKAYDEGTQSRQFGHCLVAGLEKVPLAVTKSMSKKKILKRCRVKPFVKYVNYNHIMPTRYSVDVEMIKPVFKPQDMKKVDTKKEARKNIKKALETSYLKKGKHSAGVQYFYRKLRF